MQSGYKTKEFDMSCGIEGMKTWTWFDEICLRIYSQWISIKWHLEYLAEEARRNL